MLTPSFNGIWGHLDELTGIVWILISQAGAKTRAASKVVPSQNCDSPDQPLERKKIYILTEYSFHSVSHADIALIMPMLRVVNISAKLIKKGKGHPSLLLL